MMIVLSYSGTNENSIVNTYYLDGHLQEIKGGRVKVSLQATAETISEEKLGFKVKKKAVHTQSVQVLP